VKPLLQAKPALSLSWFFPTESSPVQLGSVFKPDGTQYSIRDRSLYHVVYSSDGVAAARMGSVKKIKLSGRKRRLWQMGVPVEDPPRMTDSW